ncbi:3-deoxy-7-phosphoheptulonate synthase [Candidatus Woesearchaeota archaeon]|nr:3-deoxy-7-phosphoheptulonate synthase [Candidatus Woesearchaeota archaeon]
MIIKLNGNKKTPEGIEKISNAVTGIGESYGGWTAQLLPSQAEPHIIGIAGDTSQADVDSIASYFKSIDPSVDDVVRVTDSPPLVSRNLYPDMNGKTLRVNVNGIEIGGDDFTVIAGPCTVHSFDQTLELAHWAKEAGANLLRGGAFKPRSDPRTFQGLGIEGLEILHRVSQITGLPVVTELVYSTKRKNGETIDCLAAFIEYGVAMGQIGATNSNSHGLITDLAQTGLPILHKRNPSASIKQYTLSLQTAWLAGNTNVVACERGVTAPDTSYQRNMMDFAAIHALRQQTVLPVIGDASHGTGREDLVEKGTLSSIIYGAQGTMVEIALPGMVDHCDYAQSLKSPKALKELIANCREMYAIVNGKH